MKRMISVLLVLLLLFSTGCGSKYEKVQGRCLVTEGEHPQYIILIDASPCVITDCSENVGSELRDVSSGDLIEIDWNGTIATTYPGQVNIFGCRIVEEGSLSDADSEIIARLNELGWSFAE